MADIGVLNLQIKANADSATQGLGKLADALTRVKNAVGNGINLGGFGDGLKKLCKIVDDELHGSTIVKLADLADSLKKLKDAGGSVSSLGKVVKAINGVSTASDSVAELKENLNEIKTMGKINVPVKAVVQENLSTLYFNENMKPMGNTPDVPELTQKYRAYPARTFEDLYNGERWRTNAVTGLQEKYKPANDLMSNWLHGQGTETEQLYAIKQAAQQCGTSIDEVKQKLAELNGEAGNSKMEEVAKDLKKVTEKARESSSVFQTLKEKFSDFIKQTKQSTFGRFIDQFGRVARLRLMRTALRTITSGISEGLENLKKYSEATGSAFSKELAGANNILTEMKNSAGAAIAPAISAAIPVLNAIASAAISAFNAVNQLISLLTGKSSWTKATSNTTGTLDSVKKSASGAGGAVKDMLAAWDELNVLDQNSGGGGGGGGASGLEDYANMFGEMFTFDKGIKDFVTWLEEHLPIVNALVAALASKLLGLSAPLTLAISGIALAFSAGYDIGVNGLNTTNFWEAVGGVVATTLGGAWLGFNIGGMPGMVIGTTIGFTVGMVALGLGISEGEKKRIYGKIHLTAEEIKNEINKLFKFDDITIQINNMRLRHENLTKAKEDVEKQLERMQIDYNNIVLGVNKSESIKQMQEDVKTLVTATNALIALRKETIKVGLEVTTQFDDPSEVINFSDSQWDKITEYVEGLGKQIGDILEGGIDINEEAILKKLQTKLANITDAIAHGEKAGRFVGDIQRGYSGTMWGNVDEETLKSYTSQYLEAKEEYMDALYTQAYDTKESLGALYYSLLQEMKDSPGSVSQAEIDEAYRNFIGFDIDQDVYDKWAKYGEEGRQIFTSNVSHALAAVVSRKGNWNTTLMNKSVLNGQLENLRAWIVSNIAGNIGFDNTELAKIFDTMEFSGWEVLGEKAKRGLIIEMQRQFGVGSDLYKELKSQLNIPIDDILMVNQEAWDKWSTKEKLQFVGSIAKSYGTKDALEAAKKAGLNVTGSLLDGLKSNENKVKNATKRLIKYMADELVAPGVNLDGFEESLDDMFDFMMDTGIDLENLIDNWQWIAPAIDPNNTQVSLDHITELIKKYPSTWQDELAKELQTAEVKAHATGTVDVYLETTLDIMTNIKNNNATITSASATLGEKAAAIVNNAVSGLQLLGNVVQLSKELRKKGKTVSTNAAGAYGIPTGDLFIANEAGTEFVGRIGGKNTVANQDQIVAGISSGVAEGMEGANDPVVKAIENGFSRLFGMMQNQSGRVHPNAAFGRFVQQSLNQYHLATGEY